MLQRDLFLFAWIDKLLQAMKTNARHLHLSQTDYIFKAIKRLNDEIERRERRKKLKNASLGVREHNMKINAEFSKIEYDPDFLNP